MHLMFGVQYRSFYVDLRGQSYFHTYCLGDFNLVCYFVIAAAAIFFLYFYWLIMILENISCFPVAIEL